MLKADYSRNPNGYYVMLRNTINNDDITIASKLKMKISEYQQFMCDNFDAFKHYDEIYFKSYEDIQKAMEWLDSVVLAQQLAK